MALVDTVRRRTFGVCAPRTCAALACLTLFVFGAICVGTVVAAEESAQILEQRVKAAFLFKFGGYVEWPENVFPSKNSPLVIGVAGADVLAEELSQVVAGRTMNGRPVTVRRVRTGEPLSNIHILFVSRPEIGRLNEVFAQAQPVLTQGSVINFVVTENRVRFEVSLDAAKRIGLKIGAPLLSVAMRVQG